MAKRRQSRVAIAQARFLACFAGHGIISHACKDADISRSKLYWWLEHDEEFAARYQEATDDAIDLLEAEARRRALEGWEEPVFQQGKEVGRVRKFSDTLMILKLKAKRPEYRDRYEVTGTMAVGSAEAVNILNEGRKRALLEAAK